MKDSPEQLRNRMLYGVCLAHGFVYAILAICCSMLMMIDNFGAIAIGFGLSIGFVLLAINCIREAREHYNESLRQPAWEFRNRPNIRL